VGRAQPPGGGVGRRQRGAARLRQPQPCAERGPGLEPPRLDREDRHLLLGRRVQPDRDRLSFRLRGPRDERRPRPHDAHRRPDCGGDRADIASFALCGAGQRRKTQTLQNGSQGFFSYDGFRRPTEISHKTGGGTQFAGFTYAWDKNDNPLMEQRSHTSDKGDVYTYDKANRLTKVLRDVDDAVAEVATPNSETYVNMETCPRSEVRLQAEQRLDAPRRDARSSDRMSARSGEALSPLPGGPQSTAPAHAG